MSVNLKEYSNHTFRRGRSRFVEALWMFVQWLFVSSWIPGAAHRRWLLRLFGARIGKAVDIKPGVRVKFPWRLKIGNHSWIGENVWIDNLADIDIAANCCISQGVYLCTGSQDWKCPTFDLIVKPIQLEQGAWVAAQASVAPGVRIGEGAVLTLGSCAVKNLDAWGIYQGNPARLLGQREIR